MFIKRGEQKITLSNGIVIDTPLKGVQRFDITYLVEDNIRWTSFNIAVVGIDPSDNAAIRISYGGDNCEWIMLRDIVEMKEVR